jgi:putative addiction module component (TIGR02574 family)
MSTDQIAREAMALPAEERAKLAGQLLDSLDSPEQEAIDAAWAAEIERRIGELESGRATTRPTEDVIREARERLERK